MNLTPFGHASRSLRARYEVTLLQMAYAMDITCAHLSGIETGRHELTKDDLRKAIGFFQSNGIKEEELGMLRALMLRMEGATRLNKIMKSIYVEVHTEEGMVHRFECVSAPPEDVVKVLREAGLSQTEATLPLRIIDYRVGT